MDASRRDVSRCEISRSDMSETPLLPPSNGLGIVDAARGTIAGEWRRYSTTGRLRNHQSIGAIYAVVGARAVAINSRKIVSIRRTMAGRKSGTGCPKSMASRTLSSS